MKKVVFILTILFFAFLSNAQTGIGTTAPVNKFQVETNVADPLTTGNNVQNGHLRLTGIGVTHMLDVGLMSSTSNFGTWIQARKKDNFGVNYNLLLNPNGGAVGVGTNSPTTTLTVGNVGGTVPGEITLNPTGTTNEGGQISIKKSLSGGTVDWTIDHYGTSNSDARFRIFPGGNESSGIVLKENGFIGIGSTAPTATLDVNGNIANGTYSGTISGFSANLNSPTSATISYTILSSDNGKILNFTGSSAITITVPTGLQTGFNCMIVQNGSGQITISPVSASVTINNRNGFNKTSGQYSIVTLIHMGSNIFISSGEMSN